MSLRISTAPHMHNPLTTQRLMQFVFIALLPTAAWGVYAFGFQALLVLCVSIASPVLAEFIWQKIAKQPVRINDFSALVTGLILGLNLPATAPWWMVLIGAFFAVIIVKQLFGGMMTGMCIPNDQMPIAKSTNGIVVLNEKQAKSKDESPCIHCGRCVAACPIGLNPYQIKVAADKSDFAAAQKLHVMDCILCGSCAYECPSRRWLTPSFKFCKDHITAEAKAKAAAAAEKGGAKK